ncbi:hypothetical protein M3J09_008485 [Ascochyta lentis]
MYLFVTPYPRPSHVLFSPHTLPYNTHSYHLTISIHTISQSDLTPDFLEMAGEVTRTRAEDRAVLAALMTLPPPPTLGRPLTQADVGHQTIPATEPFTTTTAMSPQPDPTVVFDRVDEHTRSRRQVLFGVFWPDTTH